jgi:hypothetical protein
MDGKMKRLKILQILKVLKLIYSNYFPNLHESFFITFFANNISRFEVHWQIKDDISKYVII